MVFTYVAFIRELDNIDRRRNVHSLNCCPDILETCSIEDTYAVFFNPLFASTTMFDNAKCCYKNRIESNLEYFRTHKIDFTNPDQIISYDKHIYAIVLIKYFLIQMYKKNGIHDLYIDNENNISIEYALYRYIIYRTRVVLGLEVLPRLNDVTLEISPTIDTLCYKTIQTYLNELKTKPISRLIPANASLKTLPTLTPTISAEAETRARTIGTGIAKMRLRTISAAAPTAVAPIAPTTVIINKEASEAAAMIVWEAVKAAAIATVAATATATVLEKAAMAGSMAAAAVATTAATAATAVTDIITADINAEIYEVATRAAVVIVPLMAEINTDLPLETLTSNMTRTAVNAASVAAIAVRSKNVTKAMPFAIAKAIANIAALLVEISGAGAELGSVAIAETKGGAGSAKGIARMTAIITSAKMKAIALARIVVAMKEISVATQIEVALTKAIEVATFAIIERNIQSEAEAAPAAAAPAASISGTIRHYNKSSNAPSSAKRFRGNEGGKRYIKHSLTKKRRTKKS